MKTTSKVDFTGVKWTQLVTLNHRAIDARSANPILHDQAAAEAVERIDFDFNS